MRSPVRRSRPRRFPRQIQDGQGHGLPAPLRRPGVRLEGDPCRGTRVSPRAAAPHIGRALRRGERRGQVPASHGIRRPPTREPTWTRDELIWPVTSFSKTVGKEWARTIHASRRYRTYFSSCRFTRWNSADRSSGTPTALVARHETSPPTTPTTRARPPTPVQPTSTCSMTSFTMRPRCVRPRS